MKKGLLHKCAAAPFMMALFLRGLFVGGQVVHDEPEDGAFAQRALHAEAEAVLLEDGLGDGKAQPGALLAASERER